MREEDDRGELLETSQTVNAAHEKCEAAIFEAFRKAAKESGKSEEVEEVLRIFEGPKWPFIEKKS